MSGKLLTFIDLIKFNVAELDKSIKIDVGEDGILCVLTSASKCFCKDPYLPAVLIGSMTKSVIMHYHLVI